MKIYIAVLVAFFCMQMKIHFAFCQYCVVNCYAILLNYALITLEFTATHLPSFATVAYTVLWIYLPFSLLPNQNKYAMCIQWWQTWWVLLVPSTTHIPSFVTAAHIELNSGYLPFLLLANQNRYANEILNIQIYWWQTPWIICVPTTTNM